MDLSRRSFPIACHPLVHRSGSPPRADRRRAARRLEPFRLAPLFVGLLLPHAGPARAEAPSTSWDITRIGLAWQVSEMAAARVTTGLVYAGEGSEARTFDLYAPASASVGLRGAVLFVNGVGDGPTHPLRDWQIYVDWARAVTTRDLVGILHASRQGHTVEDLAALLDHLRRVGPELGIDPDRIGLWSCSANVGTALPALAHPSASKLACAVFYYGATGVDSIPSGLPVMYVKAELDGAGLNQGIDALWDAARERSLPWTMTVARGLPHAFDAVDVSDASRGFVQQTLDFYRTHLAPLPAAPANPIERRVNRSIYAGDWAGTAALLEPIMAAGTADPDAGRLLLLAYRNMREHERGLALADRLIAERPERPDLRSTRGLLLSAAGRNEEALAELEHAVELGARDFFTHSQLLMSALTLGRTADAVRYGRAAAALYPNIAVVQYNLSCALARNAEPEAALDALAAALRAGYRDRAAIDGDPDLESLRTMPRYRELMDGLEP
jgi:tetratricopeptide (TPR) repeat protein